MSNPTETVILADLPIDWDEGILGKANTLRLSVHYGKEIRGLQPRGYFLTATPALSEGGHLKCFLSSQRSRLIEETKRFSDKRLKELALAYGPESVDFKGLVAGFEAAAYLQKNQAA